MITQGTEKIFDSKARHIAKDIGQDSDEHSDFRGFRQRWQEPGVWEDIVYSNNGVKYFYNRYAYVMFKDFRMVLDENSKPIFGPAIPVDTEIIQSHSATITNASDLDITHMIATKSKNEESFESVTSQSIKVKNTFSLKIGGNLSPVSAGIDVSLEVKAAFTQKYKNKDRREINSYSKLIIPAQHRAIFTKDVSAGSYRQKFEKTGVLECKVEVYSHGNFHHRWDSFSQLKAVGSAKVYDDDVSLARFYRDAGHDKHLVDELNKKDTHVTLVGEMFYNKKSTGNVNFRLVPLEE